MGSTSDVSEPREGAAGSRGFDLDAWIRPLCALVVAGVASYASYASYVYQRELPCDWAATARPSLTLANPDDAGLRRAVGVYPGWSCAVHGSALGGRTVTFMRREKGLIVEQYVFAE